jgi:Spy/CpxP family protein refolding chaperone
MSRKLLTTLTALSVLLALSIGVAAKQRPEHGGDRDWRHGHEGMRPGFGGDPERMVEMMSRHLDLDETQALTISNILQAVQPEADALRERSRANHEALRGLDVNDADYNATLQNLSAESGELAAERTLLHGRVRGEIHAVLSAEQQQVLAERGKKMGRYSQHGRHDQRDESPE